VSPTILNENFCSQETLPGHTKVLQKGGGTVFMGCCVSHPPIVKELRSRPRENQAITGPVRPLVLSSQLYGRLLRVGL
jgi:hypothetical protein